MRRRGYSVNRLATAVAVDHLIICMPFSRPDFMASHHERVLMDGVSETQTQGKQTGSAIRYRPSPTEQGPSCQLPEQRANHLPCCFDLNWRIDCGWAFAWVMWRRVLLPISISESSLSEFWSIVYILGARLLDTGYTTLGHLFAALAETQPLDQQEARYPVGIASSTKTGCLVYLVCRRAVGPKR